MFLSLDPLGKNINNPITKGATDNAAVDLDCGLY
jgi:hypothetical protein